MAIRTTLSSTRPSSHRDCVAAARTARSVFQKKIKQRRPATTFKVFKKEVTVSDSWPPLSLLRFAPPFLGSLVRVLALSLVAATSATPPASAASAAARGEGGGRGERRARKDLRMSDAWTYSSATATRCTMADQLPSKDVKPGEQLTISIKDQVS